MSKRVHRGWNTKLLAKSPPAQWMSAVLPDVRYVCRADSFVALQAMAEKDLGLTVLPCCLGEHTSRLTPFAAPIDAIETTLWLLTRN